jgi:hypothetical protein
MLDCRSQIQTIQERISANHGSLEIGQVDPAMHVQLKLRVEEQSSEIKSQHLELLGDSQSMKILREDCPYSFRCVVMNGQFSEELQVDCRP